MDTIYQTYTLDLRKEKNESCDLKTFSFRFAKAKNLAFFMWK